MTTLCRIIGKVTKAVTFELTTKEYVRSCQASKLKTKTKTNKILHGISERNTNKCKVLEVGKSLEFSKTLKKPVWIGYSELQNCNE